MNRTAFLPALALGLLVTGCATTPAPTAGLAGTSWQISTIDGAPAAEGSMLSFEADSLSASAGCNGLSGSYALSGSTLTSGPLAATRMYCDGRMEHETALGTLLQEGATVVLDGDRLALSGAGHRLQAVRQP